MIYCEEIIDRKFIAGELCIKHGLRKVKLTDWFPVIKLFLSICWPDKEGYRIDIKTAWNVAESVNGIVRDVNRWKRMNTI